MKISQLYRIEDGPLAGTEIEFPMGFVSVKYPHRQSKDLYVPPMKSKDKEVKTFHCCQTNCKQPDFTGTLEALLDHLELHAGRLFKKLKPITKSNPPKVVITLPPNPYGENDNRGANPDRRLCVHLYMDSLRKVLNRQGIGIIERANGKEKPICEERAIDEEAPIDPGRASKAEESSREERARGYEQPILHERATAREKTISPERASVREKPKRTERAILAE